MVTIIIDLIHGYITQRSYVIELFSKLLIVSQTGYYSAVICSFISLSDTVLFWNFTFIIYKDPGMNLKQSLFAHWMEYKET